MDIGSVLKFEAMVCYSDHENIYVRVTIFINDNVKKDKKITTEFNITYVSFE